MTQSLCCAPADAFSARRCCRRYSPFILSTYAYGHVQDMMCETDTCLRLAAQPQDQRAHLGQAQGLALAYYMAWGEPQEGGGRTWSRRGASPSTATHTVPSAAPQASSSELSRPNRSTVARARPSSKMCFMPASDHATSGVKLTA